MSSNNLFGTDYNSGGSSSDGDDGDYEERDSLKLSNYAIVSAEISRLSEYSGSFGQSLIVDLDDVRVLDGLVYDRQYGEDDDTIKVFGYDKWFKTDENGQLDEEVEEKLINYRTTETFGGTDYPYEFVDRTTQNDEPIDIGDLEMWLSNGTKNRTFAKVVTPAGHGVIDDEEDDNSWFHANKAELRNDLEGRRIAFFYKKETFTPDGEDESVEYTDAVVLDEESMAGITIQNGESSSSSNDSDDGDGGSLGGDGGLPEGVPDELDEIIGFMARTDETEPENVEQLVAGELDDGEVDDVDLEAVISEIKNRR